MNKNPNISVLGDLFAFYIQLSLLFFSLNKCSQSTLCLSRFIVMAALYLISRSSLYHAM